MKAYVIAQIIAGGKVVGYKIYDAESKKTVMSPTANLIKTIGMMKPEEFKNVGLVNGKLVGTNGKLDRYAKIDLNNNLLEPKAPVVVLHKLGEVGYELVDYNGKTTKVSVAQAVEYASTLGIANGKLVTQDNVERISSITDSYETVAFTPSKAGSNTRVNIPIRTGSDVKQIAKHTKEDIESEMEYNDVFSAMSSDQRDVLKQYYTWYTVDAYKKLAKNARLELAPGKAEKLAQLRGVDKWMFAGINDSYLEGNFKAHCELGHRLRYEYFAIPEDALDENSNVRVKAVSEGGNRHRYVGGFRARKSTLEELRENGAIVFGETCAGDFFNIATEDMKKLVKTRKTMSDEIEIMSNVLTNHLESETQAKCKLLTEIISKLGNTENIVKAFGENVGYTLLAFMKTKMPFPESLVILAAEEARKNKKEFWTNVFPEHANVIDACTKEGELVHGLEAARFVIDFISDYTIEGSYSYDPLNDNDNRRRDIGKYNKETRDIRESQLRTILRTAGLLVKYPNKFELAQLDKYFKVIGYMLGLRNELTKEFEKSTIVKEKYTKVTKLNYYIENSLLQELAENDTNKLSEQLWLIISSMMFMDNSKGNFYANGYYQRGSYVRYCSVPVFKKGVIRYGHCYIERMGNIDDVFNIINDINSKPSVVATNVIKYIEGKVNQELEAEKLKTWFYKITPKYGLDKYKDESTIVAKLDYISNIEFKACYDIAKKEVINNTYGINANEFELDGEQYSTLVNVDDIERCYEITEGDYNFYIEEIKRSKSRHLAMLKRLEAQRKEEEARLAELQRKQEEEAAAKAKAEMADEAKLDELRQLINKHKDKVNNYGIRTAEAILNQGIIYSKMSSRQKWRIDTTLKELREIDAGKQKEKVSYDFDSLTYDTVSVKPKKSEVELKQTEETVVKNNTAEVNVETNIAESTTVEPDIAEMFSNISNNTDILDGGLADVFTESINEDTENEDNGLSSMFESAEEPISSENMSLADMFGADDTEEQADSMQSIFKPIEEEKPIEVKEDTMNNSEGNAGLQGTDKEMVDALIRGVNIKSEKDYDLAFAAKVALTANRTGRISDKQRKYLEKGYNKLRGK